MLKCPIFKCKGKFNGVTGLMELQSIRKHFSKKHWHGPVSMEDAMDIRALAEKKEEYDK